MKFKVLFVFILCVLKTGSMHGSTNLKQRNISKISLIFIDKTVRNKIELNLKKYLGREASNEVLREITDSSSKQLLREGYTNNKISLLIKEADEGLNYL